MISSLQRMSMYHIIYNPIAGKKNALKNLRVAEDILTKRGVAYQAHGSRGCQDVMRIARELSKQGERDFIIIGGDGTLHEALNGLCDPSACRIGLIPSGTGNDFAARMGLSLNAEKSTLQILDGEIKDTDYLEIGGVRCMNVGGLGIDVEVLEHCKRGKIKGKLKYLLSLVRCLFTFKGCKVELECEGLKTEKDVLIATVCNGSQFGGGIPICPTAAVDDGKIDVVVVDCIGGVLKIVGAFIQLMKGKILEYRATTHFLCERIRFAPRKLCTVQLDGELYKGLDFDVKICRGLKFYC